MRIGCRAKRGKVMNEVNKAKGVTERHVETKTKTRTTWLPLVLVWCGNGDRVKKTRYTLKFDPILFSEGWIANNIHTQNVSCRHHKIIELKKRLLGSMLGLTALTYALSAYAATPSPTPAGLPILSPGGAYAASSLVAKVRRSETHIGKAIAKLTWRAANALGSQQRIDITMYWDGFEKGNFQTIGPNPPDQSFVELDRLEPGINYYWRVLTLTPEGWVPSETARCAVPAYPIDRPEKEVQQ